MKYDPQRYDPQLGVRIPREVKDILCHIAESRNMTVSMLTREVLTHYASNANPDVYKSSAILLQSISDFVMAITHHKTILQSPAAIKGPSSAPPKMTPSPTRGA